MKEMLTCCFCGVQFEKTDTFWGHDPYPVIIDETSVCCTPCNKYIVCATRTDTPENRRWKEAYLRKIKS